MVNTLPKYKYCFIVLHFKNYETTKECVDSILSLNESDRCQITIMDNGSMNGSGELLQDHYKDNAKIHVIVNKEKKGFSRGNNIAYEYVKKNYKYDFIIFTNNDIVFDDKNFLEKIRSLYRKNHFDILGPDIVTVGSEMHCSPLREKVLTYHESKRLLKSYKMMWKFTTIYMLIRKIKHILNVNSEKNYATNNWNKECRQVVLCGACFVMTSDFLIKKSKPFYPETQFYYEEEILTYQALKMNGLILYSPNIYVLHNHSQATKSLYKNKIKRQKFQGINDYNSLKTYMDLIDRKENS